MHTSSPTSLAPILSWRPSSQPNPEPADYGDYASQYAAKVAWREQAGTQGDPFGLLQPDVAGGGLEFGAAGQQSLELRVLVFGRDCGRRVSQPVTWRTVGGQTRSFSARDVHSRPR
jgi:hypothetical protein